MISRDGDVYVYQNGNKVAGVTSNQLAATNEDGKKVYNVFNVDLRVNEPNTGAVSTRFKDVPFHTLGRCRKAAPLFYLGRVCPKAHVQNSVRY